jgi:hypothetical protein
LEVSPLVVEGTTPVGGGALAADAAIRVRFSAYLEPGLRWGSGARLLSGDQEVGFSAGYDPVDRALVVQPSIDLRVGLAYTFALDAESVRAVDGRALEAPVEIDFVAGPPTGDRAERGAAGFFDTGLRLMLDRKCTCHGPAPRDWPALRPDTLINVPSRRDPGRMLVAPGDPLNSTLVLKLLPDYPGVSAEPMPPEGPLAPEEIRRVLAWVEAVPAR